MNDSYDRFFSNVACFTGHRTLNGVYFNREAPSPEWKALAWKMREIVEGLMVAYYLDYLVGGALGVDMVAGLVLCKLKEDKNNNGVFDPYPKVAGNKTRLGSPWIHLALPFQGHDRKWRYDRDRNDLARICDMSHYHSNPIYVCDNGYHPSKMHRRNEYMVDNSSIVIAVWDGREEGGTYACLKYARKMRRDIIIINPYTLETKWDETKRPLVF